MAAKKTSRPAARKKTAAKKHAVTKTARPAAKKHAVAKTARPAAKKHAAKKTAAKKTAAKKHAAKKTAAKRKVRQEAPTDAKSVRRARAFLDEMFALDVVGDAMRALAEDGVLRVAIRRNDEDEIELDRLSSAADRSRANAKHRKVIDDMLTVEPVVIAMTTLAKKGVFEVAPPPKVIREPAPPCFAMSLRSGRDAEASSDVLETTLPEHPSCDGCGQPMKALALLHAHDQRLPLQKHEAVGIFVCTRPWGDDWNQWWDTCALANQPNAKGGLTVRLYEKAPPTTGGHAVYYEVVEDHDDDFDGSEETGPLPIAGSKLGGKARWSGAIDRPDEGHGAWNRPMTCPTCDKLMRFAGQVCSMKDLAFDAGDGFGVYLFLCADEHAARVSAFVD